MEAGVNLERYRREGCPPLPSSEAACSLPMPLPLAAASLMSFCGADGVSAAGDPRLPGAACRKAPRQAD